MIITVKRKDGERQSPIVTIDTETCLHPYAIMEALELALKLDGHDENAIKQVFNQGVDVNCAPEPSACIEKRKEGADDKMMNFGNFILGEIWNKRLVNKPDCWYLDSKKASIFDLLKKYINNGEQC